MSAAGEAAGSPEDPDGPGQTLFAFVRHWSRRAGPESGPAGEQGRQVAVVEAARSLADAGGAPSVNAVAVELGLDQSGASRLIKDAVAAGRLRLERSSADGRSRVVTVTAAGRGFLADAHRWQEHVFGELTQGWTARQRVDFHRALLRLLDRSRSRNA